MGSTAPSPKSTTINGTDKGTDILVGSVVIGQGEMISN